MCSSLLDSNSCNTMSFPQAEGLNCLQAWIWQLFASDSYGVFWFHHTSLCSWDLVWDFYCLEITCGSKVRGSLTNPAIPFPDRITTALHTPARKVGGFKSLQVVAVVRCSVLRFFRSVCFVGWLGFFLLWFFKNSIEDSFSSVSNGNEGVLLEQWRHTCFLYVGLKCLKGSATMSYG